MFRFSALSILDKALLIQVCAFPTTRRRKDNDPPQTAAVAALQSAVAVLNDSLVVGTCDRCNRLWQPRRADAANRLRLTDLRLSP